MRILFVQHGDYRSAYERLRAGEPETYRDQARSVHFVAELAPAAVVTTVTIGEARYDVELAPNLFAIGIMREDLSPRFAADLLKRLAPDRVILRTPRAEFLEAAVRCGAAVLPCFADIFSGSGVRGMMYRRRLRKALSLPNIPCVANHSLNASRSLEKILGISPERIVPWDWSRVPISGPPKPGLANPARPTGLYAGALSAAKGVGDCLEAVQRLRAGGLDFTMAFAGPGDAESWKARAIELGIGDAVEFLGVVSNTEVREKMRAADLVIVPSRHSYPEGLPNTIYEALASRSPLLMSDHPSFVGRLRPDEQCLIFAAENADEMAAAIRRLVADNALYAKLSENAEEALAALFVGLEWIELVNLFLSDPGNKSGWVEQNALSRICA